MTTKSKTPKLSRAERAAEERTNSILELIASDEPHAHVTVEGYKRAGRVADNVLAASAPAGVPSFVAVAQPNFIWHDRAPVNKGGQNKTILPNKTGPFQEAAIFSSDASSPDGRAVRLHELLHARFTPDVSASARRLRQHGVSDLAINLAEDVRLGRKAEQLGLHTVAEAHITDDTVARHLVALAQRHGANVPIHKRVTHLDTGKVVQAAIGLSVTPHQSSEQDDEKRVDVRDPASLCRLATRISGASPALVAGVDISKATALLEEFYTRVGEITSAPRKGAQAEAALFVDLANLTEDILRRAYDVEQPPQAGSSGGSESGGSEGGEAGNQSGEGQQGQQNQDQDQKEQDQGQDESQDGDQDQQDQDGDQDSKEETSGDKAGDKSGRASGGKSGRQAASKPQFGERGKSPLASRAAFGAFSRVLKTKARAGQPTSTGSAFEAAAVTNRVVEVRGQRGQQDQAIPAGATINAHTVINYSLDPHARWAPAELVAAPMVRPKKALVPRRGKPAVDGSIPRHYARWFVDRAILDAKGRRPGGTLLLDVSGSMNWAEEDTRLLLEICPALTVAAYSSHAHNSSKGAFTLLARNGRTIAKDYNWRVEHNHGGGNACDGIALSWLAKQPGPRIWYSDGQVTGPGDSAELGLLEDALRLCVVGQITRTINRDRVVRILAGKEKQSPVSPHILAQCRAALRSGNGRRFGEICRDLHQQEVNELEEWRRNHSDAGGIDAERKRWAA